MEKKGMEYSFLQLVLVMFVVVLLMGALYNYYYKPLKGTATPIIGDLEKKAQNIGSLGDEDDRDNDGVPDEVDKCCDCYRIGNQDVAKTGERPGCAADQKESVCTTSCVSVA